MAYHLLHLRHLVGHSQGDLPLLQLLLQRQLLRLVERVHLLDLMLELRREGTRSMSPTEGHGIRGQGRITCSESVIDDTIAETQPETLRQGNKTGRHAVGEIHSEISTVG